MLKQQEYIINTQEEFCQIESVKEQLDELVQKGSFFQLSLKTLELIRRFNSFYTQVYEKQDKSPQILNQLVITSQSLETELVREN